MTWSITSCESPLTLRRLMPVSMAILRPQRRALYSAMLFDAGKCMRTAYLMCSLLTVKIHQPSHEFTFGVGISFIPYPLVLTPVV
jgi:hypothetical protein